MGSSVGQRPPAELGEPLEELRPAVENVVAGYIIAALLACVGLALLAWISWEIIQAGGKLPLNADTGMSWLTAGIAALLGIGAIAGGKLTLWVVNLFRGHGVWVCAEGLYFPDGSGSGVSVRWDQVESVKETVLQEHFPLKGIAKYALPVGKSRSYLICWRGGFQIGADGNTVRRIGRLGQVLEERAEKYGFAWQVVHRSK